jgi:hypothetical protein
MVNLHRGRGKNVVRRIKTDRGHADGYAQPLSVEIYNSEITSVVVCVLATLELAAIEVDTFPHV